MRLPLVIFGKVMAGEVTVNGGVAAVSPAGELDSSSCGPAGVVVSSKNISSGIMGEMASRSSSSIMAVRITNISPSSLCSGTIISSLFHATSTVAPLIGSNDFVHRGNIYTSAKDQSLGLEGRGTAGSTPRGTKKNHRS